MRKYISLGLGLLAISYVLFSFFGKAPTSPRILFFDVNIWVYRLFWAVLGFFMIVSYINQGKASRKGDS